MLYDDDAPNAILVASFWNEGDSKTNDIENRGQILHFLTLVKIREGMGKNAEGEDRIHPTA